jgi:hypothetical protein
MGRIKLLILIVLILFLGACMENKEIKQTINESTPREIPETKATIQTPTNPQPTTTTIPEEVQDHTVKILYFGIDAMLVTTGMPMASVKLSWYIIRADENRNRLDASWVPSIGFRWVQVPVGIEIPFRLVVHGIDGSLDIRLIQVLAK